MLFFSGWGATEGGTGTTDELLISNQRVVSSRYALKRTFVMLSIKHRAFRFCNTSHAEPDDKRQVDKNDIKNSLPDLITSTVLCAGNNQDGRNSSGNKLW